MPTSRLNPADRARYARQIRLSGFGESAQAALLDSHVLVIGAGGLGAPILSYLAAVGIGTITVIDPDIVELSNLHRQVIHSEAAIGTRKIDSAKERMNGINSSIGIRTIPELLTPDNARTSSTASTSSSTAATTSPPGISPTTPARSSESHSSGGRSSASTDRSPSSTPSTVPPCAISIPRFPLRAAFPTARLPESSDPCAEASAQPWRWKPSR